MTKIGRVTLRGITGRKEAVLIRLNFKLCNKHTDCRDNGIMFPLLWLLYFWKMISSLSTALYSISCYLPLTSTTTILRVITVKPRWNCKPPLILISPVGVQKPDTPQLSSHQLQDDDDKDGATDSAELRRANADVLKAEQHQDPTLAACHKSASRGRGQFYIEADLLFHSASVIGEKM